MKSNINSTLNIIQILSWTIQPIVILSYAFLMENWTKDWFAKTTLSWQVK